MMATEHPQILVVDDDADMCWVLKSVLRRAGYVVTTTLRGGEALERCECQRYALVLADAKLRDLDGLDLIATLRQRAPDTHIVLISGYLNAEDALVVEGLRQGKFDRFFAKPFDVREVRDAVALLCDASPSV